MWLLAASVLVAGTVASFTDWLFMGVLFHDRYNNHPEVWRSGVREGKERGAIVWSAMLGYLSAAAIVALCAITGASQVGTALLLAGLVWIAGVLPVTIANGLFIKFDNALTLSHSLGYLVRLLIAAVCAAFALQYGSA